MRVTHVVLSLECGGLERVVLGLVRAGRARGQDVSVVCLERPGALAAEVEAAGARVACVHKRPGLRFETVAALREVFRELRPDVVHTHQIGALLYAGPAARRVGVPAVVHTEHIDNAGKLTSRWRRLRLRLLWKIAARYASHFFCVSGDIADSVTAYGVVPRRKVEVVPNGIDTRAPHDPDPALRRSLGLPAGAPVIGTVGRLNEVKRQDLLLRAFAEVRRRHPDARLLVVGDGPEREALRRLAGELGVTESVHFAGYQPRPEQFLRLMDVFALPSRLEGMPLVILEAWAARLPVVATAVGGVPRLVEDGRTGLLVPSGDADALAESLAALLADPARAGRLAEAGRGEVCRSYGLDRMAETYARAYAQARSGKAAARPRQDGLQPDAVSTQG